MCKSGKCKSGKGCLCIIKNLKLKCFVKIEVAARNFKLCIFFTISFSAFFYSLETLVH